MLVFGRDEERFIADPVATMEEIVEQAREELDEGQHFFFVGVMAARKLSDYIDLGDVLERAGESASEEVGDVAEDWLPFGGEPLATEFAALIDSFAARHKLDPTFFAVKNVKRYELTEEGAVEAPEERCA